MAQEQQPDEIDLIVNTLLAAYRGQFTVENSRKNSQFLPIDPLTIKMSELVHEKFVAPAVVAEGPDGLYAFQYRVRNTIQARRSLRGNLTRDIAIGQISDHRRLHPQGVFVLGPALSHMRCTDNKWSAFFDHSDLGIWGKVGSETRVRALPTTQITPTKGMN